tara:strand:+ start:803 stop:1957 length:1155 start_codon:yes stop_codon:yes gene_type:complete
MQNITRVDFFRHNIKEEDIEAAAGVMRSIFLTTGDVVEKFETTLCEYLSCEYAIGVTSCTAALHLSLLAFDIGPGDEVITTPMSFVATANAIMHAGATPVFVDVEPQTGNINADLIEDAITAETKAIMPVHLYGSLCDMRKIRDIADKHNLKVIEDSAHMISGERDGIKPGELGDAACFSFYATKEITSGEGGAITVHDKHISDRLKRLRLHGLSSNAADRYTSNNYSHYDVDECGWKYNMDNIQAAILIGQLDRLNEQREIREQICKQYEDAFHELQGIDYPIPPIGSTSSRHLFTIWVNPKSRDAIIWELQKKNIGVAVNFRSIHLMHYYKSTFGYIDGSFPVSESIGHSTLTLPLHTKLNEKEIDYVISNVQKAVEENSLL